MDDFVYNLNDDFKIKKDINYDNLNDEQRECVNAINGHILVLSGAGTGKTRIIVYRFLKIIENNINPKNIMCVTFSNKAANEIIKRISEYLDNVDGLWIGTFHRICFRILQKYANLPNNVSIIDEYDQKNILEKLKISDFLKNIQDFKENLPVIESDEFKNAYNIYQNFINENNLLDFGEIIIRTVKFLEENPIICQHIREQFKYIMIDEYQDTSKLQGYLIQLLVKDNLCCVGDDDQSIYSWRGACVENTLNFKDYYPMAKIFKLERNYRSSKQILAVANHIIQQNINRMSKKIWTDVDGSSVKICCTRYEPDFIAQEILNLRNNNENIGILVRSSILIKPIEIALVKYNIPYKIIGGLRFFEKLEIKTAIAYLKAIFLEDILSIERILTTPKRGIGPKKVQRVIQQIQQGLSLLSALREIGCGDLAEKITEWKTFRLNNPVLIMKKIWSESGCSELFDDRLENFQILLDKLGQFSTAEDFLQNFFTIDTDDECRVSIMTIHGSKGLEFDNVFIPGLTEGSFPHAKTIMEGNLEEERRLAYVAFTRAKNKLFLTYNLSNSMTRSTMFGPSRFLFNLPKNSINYEIM